MKILQSGIAKSGNYWLYTILRKLIDKSDLHYSSYIIKQPIYKVAKQWKLSQHNQSEIDVLEIKPNQILNRISQIYKMPIYDIDDYLNDATITWSHSIFYKNCLNIYKKFDKIVYIIRDPRAVIISSAKFRDTKYVQSLMPKASSNENTNSYLEERFERAIGSWGLKMLSFIEVSKLINIYPIFYEN